MAEYEAALRIEGDKEPPLHVEVDLTEDRLTVRAGDIEVVWWDRGALRISAHPDGFHIRTEGEVIVLDVTEDARFALELGLRNAHPNLRRKMSALLREQPY